MSRPPSAPAPRVIPVRLAGAALALLLCVAGPAQGAGFGIFEQGTKAMGMAGAFTAQADDGSAMFHNIAGIGFIEEKMVQAGVTLITSTESEFDGANPFPGDGLHWEGETAIFTPPHVYYVNPVGDRVTFGFGLYTPFGLATEWEDPDNYPGRFISARAELQTFDINPGFAVKVTDTFSVGMGVILRLANVELRQYLPVFDPFTFTVRNAGTATLEATWEHDWGYTLGILHKPSDRLSWGLSYRSEIDMDLAGEGDFEQISTGNPALDAAVAANLPFGDPIAVRTGVEFPRMASLGVAVGVTDSILVEVDANWTGWSSFEELVITFPENSGLSSVRPQNYEDAWNYRLGLAFDLGANQIRLGYVFDESPQPDESVGPLLPDADRQGFTLGYGWTIGDGQGSGLRPGVVDLALMYLPFDERTITNNLDNFNGTWNTTAWLFGATLSF